MRGDRQDDDVGLADDLLGRRRARAGGEHVDGQRDRRRAALTRTSRRRNRPRWRRVRASCRTCPRRRCRGADRRPRHPLPRRRARSLRCAIVNPLPGAATGVRLRSRREQLADPRDHLAAIELDRGQPLLVRDPSDGVVQVEAAEAERPGGGGDPVGDGLRRADVHRAVIDLGLELLVGRRPPAALARRPLELLLVVRPLDPQRVLVRVGDEPERVQPDRATPAGRAARAPACRARRTARTARALPAMTASISGRPKRAARTTDCGLPPTPTQVGMCPVGDRRADELVRERRPEVPRPGHGLLAEQAYEQVELLFEQLLVVGEVEAEEREGLGQRAAADDQLRPAVRDGVERREVGVQPHRILRAENGHGRCRAGSAPSGSRSRRGRRGLPSP